METPTLPAAERFTIIREKLRLRLDAEGPRYNIARAVDLLVLELITWMISLAISRAERGLDQQACQDDAGVEPGCIRAAGGFAGDDGDGGADRREAADAAHAGGRVAVKAAVAAADGVPVIDGATQENCVSDEVCVRAECERRPCELRHLVAVAHAVAVLECGSWGLEARFAKMELGTWVELRRFRYDLAMVTA